MLRCVIAAVLCCAGILEASAVRAAGLEEILVTARKREEPLADVGLAVTAFSGQELRSRGMDRLVDLERQTPGLLIGEYGAASATTTLNIRGVAQLDFVDHQESPNAVHVDGAYVSFIGGLNTSLFDVERVEVLRGPQGTLFGRNATGGVVQVLSRRPEEARSARIDITVAEYGRLRTEGAIGGALADGVRGRLAVATDHHDGWLDNRGGRDVGENASTDVRGQLAFDVGDDGELLLALRYGDLDDVAAGAYHQVGAAPDPADDFLVTRIDDGNRALLDDFCTAFNGAPTVTPAGGSDCYGTVELADVFAVQPDLTGFFDRSLWGGTATLDVGVDLGVDARLVSITDFQGIDKSYLEDNDSSPLPVTVFGQYQRARQFSQELRLEGGGARRWVLGGYFLHIDSESGQRVDQNAFFDIDFRADFDHQTLSWALFGQVDQPLAPGLVLVAGARFTRDEKDIDLVNDCVDTDAFGLGGTCAVFGLAEATRVVGGIGDDDWAGRLGLEYAPSDAVLWYLGVSRGNKGGVLNAVAGAGVGVTLADLRIDPEVLVAWEGGVKAALLDGRLALRSSVFHYDYDDYQAFTFEGVSSVLFNADASVTGAEVEIAAAPVAGLEVVLAAALLDARVHDVALPSGRRADQDMPFAPEFSLSGRLRRDWAFRGGTVRLQGDFTHLGGRFFSTVNHPVLSDDTVTEVNAQLGFVGPDERFEVQLFVDNLTDVERKVNAFELAALAGGYAIESYAPPRWAGVRLAWRWP